MITEIRLKNFKIFKEETVFPTNRLTLLTGVNGSGKSSMLQSLLLIWQSIEHEKETVRIIFNGSYVNLGTFTDIKNSETPRNEPILLGFSIKKKEYERDFKGAIEYLIKEFELDMGTGIIDEIHTSNKGTIFRQPDDSYFTYCDDKESYITLNLLRPITNDATFDNTLYNFFTNEPVEIDDNQNILEVFHIHYIAADRIGPKPYYEKLTPKKYFDVGIKGQNTVNTLHILGNDLVPEKLYIGKNSNTLIQQTEEWLAAILGGAKVELKGKEREHAVLSLLLNSNSSSNRYRPSNVGFGYSYILPIIVSGLIATESDILIVENPEAHLHPKAQSKLAQFLAKVASCGVQVFIETHSDYILNGIRIAVREEEIELKNDEVTVLYFQDNENERFVEIPIRADGGIDKWPDGFFDQTDKDLERILGI